MILDAYVGIPWRERGADKAGCNCWGLVRLVYREVLGINLPSFSDRYVTEADRGAVAELIAGEIGPWAEIPAGQERQCDAVLMRAAGSRHLSHVGIVAAPGMVLHVSQGIPSRVERYHSGPVRHRVAGFFRYRNG